MISEILAPIGNMEMLRPAVFSGASAVYLGLNVFNARRAAKGFSPEELCLAAQFCHARNVKIYVTLNTIVYTAEIAELCDAIRSISSAGVDAIIVQDLATAKLAQAIAPSMPLHGSTQMSVHSLAGAIALQKMGFSRVILARELSLVEIEAIVTSCTIETEVFVHGALCMSVSGQCYMSAFLGGRSGNRGSCAGPCRLPFSASDAGKCHLSLKDMSHVSHLPSLAKIGVTSFKIEGRLRSEEYVAAAVNACVCSLSGKDYDMQILQDVFSRSGFTDSYIVGNRDGNMFGVRTEADSLAARAAQPKLRELYRRELQCIGVDMWLEIAPHQIILTATDGEHTIKLVAEIEPQEAKTDQRNALLSALEKCGGTPFYVKSANIIGVEGLFVAQSAVNLLRRNCLEELLALRQQAKPHDVCEYCPPIFVRHLREKMGIIARFESVEQIPSHLGSVTYIITPLLEWRQIAPEMRASTYLELPRVAFGALEDEVRAQIALACNEGFCGFTAENIAHFELLHGQQILGGFGLNVSNPLAAQEYAKLGATISILSCELVATDMTYFDGQTASIAYAHMPLMLTRACPLQNVRSCNNCDKSGSLLDRKDVRFPLTCKNGMRTIYNPIPLYMGDKRRELATDYDVLYFTIEDKMEITGIIALFEAEAPFKSEFTRGLYFRGTN